MGVSVCNVSVEMRATGRGYKQQNNSICSDEHYVTLGKYVNRITDPVKGGHSKYKLLNGLTYNDRSE
jgi:hypothetical protein